MEGQAIYLGDKLYSPLFDGKFSDLYQQFATYEPIPNPVTSGLVLELTPQPASYPGSGTTWYDESGNGFDFTMTGTLPWTSDGFQYNASTANYFSLTNNTLNNYFIGQTNQNSMTIFVDHTPTTSDSERALIHAQKVPEEYLIVYNGVDGTETMDMRIGAPAPTYEYSGNTTGTITNGVRQIHTFTVGTNALTSYVDGVALSGTAAMSSNTYGSNAGQTWYIGVFITGGGSLTGPYNGKIKSVVVYNRVLNSTEIGDVKDWLLSI